MLSLSPVSGLPQLMAMATVLAVPGRHETLQYRRISLEG